MINLSTESFERRLIAWSMEQTGRASVWGESDCMVLGLTAVDIVLGTDHAPDYMQLYADEAGAREYCAGREPGEVLTGFGFVEIDFKAARIGDIIIGSNDRFPVCVHVCLGSRVLSGVPGGAIQLFPKRALSGIDNLSAWGAR